jgi:hypothetical protein
MEDMKSEIGILNIEDRDQLRNMISNSQLYRFRDLNMLMSKEINYFIESREHLLAVYSLRAKGLEKKRVGVQLGILLRNLSNSVENLVRVCFVGAKDDRIMIFTDLNFLNIHGVITFDHSNAVQVDG